jgi:hypothetical protein
LNLTVILPDPAAKASLEYAQAGCPAHLRFKGGRKRPWLDLRLP